MSDDISDREHPTAEKLSAYQANELSPEEDDAIQEHVASCSLCAGRLLDLQRFLEFAPEPSGERTADFATAAEWRDLRERIEKERARSRPQEFPVTRRWAPGSPATAYALAAVLAFSLIGLSIYTLRLRQELRGPELNTREIYLSSIKGTRGSEDLIKPLEPASDDSKTTFRLATSSETVFPKYRVEVRDPRGKPVLKRDDLMRQDDMFIFRLPTRGWSRGEYSIQVWGLRGAGEPAIEVEQYKFRVP